MKQEDSLLEKYGKDSGMKVPEGYLAELQANIMESLPPYVSQPVVPELSRWQRVKPYIYLAAMFCGIWLLMKVFHTVSDPLTLNLDNPPEAIVQLLEQEPDFYEYMAIPDDSDYDMEDEILASYDNFEDFEKDFNSQE